MLNVQLKYCLKLFFHVAPHVAAGSMLLACNGVCLIPDLNLVKKSEKEMLVHGKQSALSHETF